MITYATSCKNQESDNIDSSKGKSDDFKDKRSKSKKDRGSSNKEKDTEDSASVKCSKQKNDCLTANAKVSVSSGRCGSYSSGWN